MCICIVYLHLVVYNGFAMFSGVQGSGSTFRGLQNFEKSRLGRSFGGPGSYLGMETQFTNDLAQFGQTRNAQNCLKM